MNKEIISTIVLMFFANIMIWYQVNSQLVWEWAKGTKSMWFMSLMGVPISMLFWYITKFGYEGFGALWPVRFMGFATSMMTFPIMTWLYLGEVMTLKTFLTLGLAAIIMLLQLL